jgi:hypothetical protein
MATSNHGIGDQYSYPFISDTTNFNSPEYKPMTEEHLLRGKLLQVDMVHDSIMAATPDEIKFRLAQQIANELYKNDCISFTKQLDIKTGDTHYRAYVYVTPDDQTQVVRTLKKTL